jgi:hypothetical protein
VGCGASEGDLTVGRSGVSISSGPRAFRVSGSVAGDVVVAGSVNSPAPDDSVTGAISKLRQLA